MNSVRMRWVGHVAQMENMRNAYGNLVGKREGRQHLARLKRNCKETVLIKQNEIWCQAVSGFIWLRVGSIGDGLL
jgi:hypothetical protein